MKKVVHIIIIGRCMKKYIPKHIKTPVSLVNIWTDNTYIQSFKNKENPYIKQWNLKDKFIVLYSGNMGRFHDMETIIDAAALCKDDPSIIFLFIGDGYKKESIERKAKKDNLENCKFYNFVPRSDIGFPLYAANCGLVCLNNGQEGLSVPSKTYAMMAAELPILAIMNQESEISKMVNEENCGKVIVNGDASTLAEEIKLLKKNEQVTFSLGQNSLNAITRQYNLENSSSKIIDIIKLYQ